MHTFVLVVRKPGRRIPPAVVDQLSGADHPDLPFEPESHLYWTDRGETIHFGGWQAAADVFGMGSHWNVDEDGLTAFSGQLLPTDGSWTAKDSWAAQLKRRFEGSSLPASREEFRGVFIALSLAAAGGGFVVTDPLGVGVVYRADTDDFVILSSRAALAASIERPPGRSPSRDPVGVGWLVHTGYLIGNATGFSNVRTIPEGGWAEIKREGGLLLRHPPHPPWRFPDEDAYDVNDLVERVREDIASVLRTAVALPAAGRRADITGGKDSRLILAGLISEGLEREVDFYTFGASHLADVVIGGDIAEQFGLSHTAQAPGPMTEEDFDRALRIHTFQTSGMLGAWDMRGETWVMDWVHLSGVCGEILRTNFPSYREIGSADHLLSAFKAGMPFDTLRLLKPELRAYYDEKAQASLLAGSGVDEPLDLIDIFYLKNRLRRWFGTDQEIDCSNRIFPLYSLVGLRAAFAIGPVRRRNDFIPFEIMRRAAPALAKMPFARGRWAEELIQDLPDAHEYRAPAPRIPPPPSSDRPAHREWQADRLERNRDVLEKLLAGDPDHPVFEVIERDAAIAALDRTRELSPNDRIQLYGAATAAVWLSQGESRWRVPIPIPRG